jgi:hypothetical protein
MSADPSSGGRGVHRASPLDADAFWLAFEEARCDLHAAFDPGEPFDPDAAARELAELVRVIETAQVPTLDIDACFPGALTGDGLAPVRRRSLRRVPRVDRRKAQLEPLAIRAGNLGDRDRLDVGPFDGARIRARRRRLSALAHARLGALGGRRSVVRPVRECCPAYWRVGDGYWRCRRPESHRGRHRLRIVR